jgi:cytochrome c oxidase cbb3-type subunit 3
MIRSSYLILGIALLATGCEREQREFSKQPHSKEQIVALSPISPGGGEPVRESSSDAKHYENNAYQISEGKRLFTSFNCVGCHANGGGGSGPALMDQNWIYGSAMENIVSTIKEGRPNGMPSFRGKIPENQIWQIAAYVRSLSGNVSQDAAPGRSDDMHPHPAENRLPKLTPVNGGSVPPASSPPQ